MDRTAIDAIQGYLYQFHKTIFEILVSGSSEILTVEGFEDIDITNSDSTKLIQCKYHESKTKFTLSDIYKPVILMLHHFIENRASNYEYILFAHFPNEALGNKIVDKSDIEIILSTENEKLKTKAELVKSSGINVDDFLALFTFEIGQSISDLADNTQKVLLSELNGFCSDEDIKSIFYPNSIQKIANLSIQRSVAKRNISKMEFVSEIKKQKEAAITRWTRELSNYQQILKNKRSKLSVNLNFNSRLRYFIISESSLLDFFDGIVNFIDEFINKYNSKIKLHDQTPVFCLDCSDDTFSDITERLYKKGLTFRDGVIANHFIADYFLKEPIRNERKEQIEFQLRICQFNEDSIIALNSKKCDDLFLITDRNKIIKSKLDELDINIEVIETKNLEELKFVLGISKIL
jgi:hypothetical protein